MFKSIVVVVVISLELFTVVGDPVVEVASVLADVLSGLVVVLRFVFSVVVLLFGSPVFSGVVSVPVVDVRLVAGVVVTSLVVSVDIADVDSNVDISVVVFSLFIDIVVESSEVVVIYVVGVDGVDNSLVVVSPGVVDTFCDALTFTLDTTVNNINAEIAT